MTFNPTWGSGGGAVDSVNGQTGVVVLDSDDIAQGTTNLYNKVPAGGTTGQLLAKVNSTDYNAAWTSPVWEKIETKTASSSASLVFTGLSSTYLQYRIVLSRLVPATNNVDLYMRTSTDNGVNYDSGASDYQFAGDLRRVGGAATVSSAASSRMALAIDVGNTADLGGACGEIEILSFSSATYFHAHSIITHSYVTTPTFAVTRMGNWRLAAADVDAVQLYFESGNIASGTATLYGLRA